MTNEYLKVQKLMWSRHNNCLHNNCENRKMLFKIAFYGRSYVMLQDMSTLQKYFMSATHKHKCCGREAIWYSQGKHDVLGFKHTES